MVKSSSNRNSTLDIIKIIAAFFVVFIHAPFSGDFGILVKSFGGFAVPLFFIISGYYSYRLIIEDDIGKLFSRVFSLLKLFTVTLAVYSALYIFLSGTEEYFSYFRMVKTYIVFFVFTNFENEFFTPLWFLPALIYCYLVVITLIKLKLKKLIDYLPLLLVINIVLTDFIFKRYECSAIIVRNFLITGCPFFSLGFLAKKHEKTIEKKPPRFYTVALGISFILFLVFYNFLGIPTTFIFIFAAILFLLSVKTSYTVNSPFASDLLRNISTYIYVSHWAIWIILIRIGINENNPIAPLVTLLLSSAFSVVISVFLYFIKGKLKKE